MREALPAAHGGARRRTRTAGARSGRARCWSAARACSAGSRPAALGAVGFVALDGLLRVPDFRAGERAFQAPLGGRGSGGRRAGRVIVQTLHPEHYAHPGGAHAHERAAFYEPELQLPRRAGLPALPPAVPHRRPRPERGGRPGPRSRSARPRCAASRGSRCTPPTARGTPAGARPWWRVLVKGPAAPAAPPRRAAAPSARAATALGRYGRNRDGSESLTPERRHPTKGDGTRNGCPEGPRYGDPILRQKAEPGGEGDPRDPGHHRRHGRDHVSPGRHRPGRPPGRRPPPPHPGGRRQRAARAPSSTPPSWTGGGSIRGEEGCLSHPRHLRRGRAQRVGPGRGAGRRGRPAGVRGHAGSRRG